MAYLNRKFYLPSNDTNLVSQVGTNEVTCAWADHKISIFIYVRIYITLDQSKRGSQISYLPMKLQKYFPKNEKYNQRNSHLWEIGYFEKFFIFFPLKKKYTIFFNKSIHSYVLFCKKKKKIEIRS